MATDKLTDDFAVWASDLAYLHGESSAREWTMRRAFIDYIGGSLTLQFTGKIRASKKLNAKLDFERWLADCPVPGCGGSEYVDLDDPFMFCLSCGNVALDGDAYKVIFPDINKRLLIYEELNFRPMHRVPGLNRLRTALTSRPMIPGLDRNWSKNMTVSGMRNHREGIVNIIKDETPNFDLATFVTAPLPARLTAPTTRGAGRTDSERAGTVPIRRQN